MKKNLGITDKRVRILAAIIIAGLYFADMIPGVAGIVLMTVAGILLVTSLMNFCPLYSILGVNTCGIKSKE